MAVILATLFAAAAPLAAFDAAQPEPAFAADVLPPLGAPKPVTLPPVVDRSLPNGLRIVLLEDHLQPSLTMRLAIPAGTKRDPHDKIGLADATASLLDQGTSTRSEDKIADTIDGLGASLGASADSDYLFVSASGLSGYADDLVELMADITLHPTFPADEWERHRTRTLSAITADLAEPASVANTVLSRRVFGAHPYGNYETGTPETLADIAPNDLKAFHDAYFVPNGSVLFLVGDISPDRAVELATKYFGGWPSKNTPAPPPPPVAEARAKNRVTIIDRPGSEQTEIRIGTLVGGYSDPNRTVVNVANAVLGGGAFEGRLIKEIRVKRGLTYSANSSFSRQKDAGQFTISTFTKPATTGEAVRIALEEVHKLSTDGPGSDELGERKTYLTGSFAVGVATAQGVLARVVPAVLYGRGPIEVSEYVGKVESVTPMIARDALHAAVPATGLEIVLVGDAKAIHEQAAAFGDVTVIEQSDLDLNAPDLIKQHPAVDTTPFGASAAARTLGEKLLAATVAAAGGDGFLNVTSLKITGTGEFSTPAQAGGLTIPFDSFTLYAAPPGRTRLEAQSGLGPLVFGARGTGKGGFAVLGGQTQELPADQVVGIEPMEFLRAAVRNHYPVAAVTDGAALQSSDGKSLIAYDIRNDHGDITHVFVEADTKHVREFTSKRTRGETAVFLDDYRAVSGLTLPYAMHVQRNGADVFKLTFKEIVVNSPVADALFEKP